MSGEAILNHPKGAGVFPKVDLIEPDGHGYLFAAAVVDRRLPFAYFRESADKQHLLLKLKQRVDALRALPGVRAATLYKALLIPPGRGHFLKQRPAAHIARYDVAALVEAESSAAAKAVNATSEWNALQSDMRAVSKDVYAVAASNVKRIGPVDRTRDGVFLFNYFFADRLEQNLAVWEYTAGWFEYETDLHNSTVLCRSRSSARIIPSSITAAGIRCGTSCRHCCSSLRSAATCSPISRRTTPRPFRSSIVWRER
jgi:hypothetical protein